MKSKHDKHWRGIFSRRRCRLFSRGLASLVSAMSNDRQEAGRWPFDLLYQDVRVVESSLPVLGLPSLLLAEIKAAVLTLREQTFTEPAGGRNPFDVSDLGFGRLDCSGPVFLHSEITDAELGLRRGVGLLALELLPVIRPERQGVQTG